MVSVVMVAVAGAVVVVAVAVVVRSPPIDRVLRGVPRGET